MSQEPEKGQEPEMVLEEGEQPFGTKAAAEARLRELGLKVSDYEIQSYGDGFAALIKDGAGGDDEGTDSGSRGEKK